jgi:hypothetical protein
MYVSPNFKSKKALRDAIALGQEIETVEGPHYPAPHSWYAQVEMREGKVVRLVK